MAERENSRESSTDSPTADGTARAPGVFISLRAVLVTMLGIAGTRFELLGIEFAEEKERLVALALTGVAAAVALSFAVLMLTLFWVVVFWDTHRLTAIGGFALLYFVVGAWAVARLRAQLALHPPLFAATVAELKKDRDTFRSATKQDAAAGERS